MIIGHILSENNISDPAQMNYIHYEKQVIRRWGVILDGWPCDEFANPGKLIGVANVRLLWQALKDKKCKWKKLTELELAARIQSMPTIDSVNTNLLAPNFNFNFQSFPSPVTLVPGDTPNISSPDNGAPESSFNHTEKISTSNHLLPNPTHTDPPLDIADRTDFNAWCAEMPSLLSDD